MKIGIASDDQQSIAQHFGRTKGFVITELAEKKVISTEYRENNFTAHSQPAKHEAHEEHQHSHGSILAALKDCDVVIARGMGRRIYDDLRNVNIEAIITDIPAVDDAIDAYLAGTLKDNPEKGCEH
ncbi:MAG: iron-molybdenum cofactor biosynthesis protein [Candidatus Marinimicrobia bacterium]|nr:iron-molybdenum cofactor biosynthesis protein [Candidatus Neomarinimicrobiota bacterium]MCF7923311.1 iron-molybdenum cofactor biosynthesis protein [Candidatus Neomarinimicrobiota bacterium]